MNLYYTKKDSDFYSSNDKPTNSLIGEWKLKYNNGVSPDGDELIMKFKSDGTVSQKSDNEKAMGIWTFCENQLSAVFLSRTGSNCNEYYSMEGTFHVGSNELTWYTINEGEKIELIYERK